MDAAVVERERAAGFRATCEDPMAFREWYDAALPTVYGYLLPRCAGDVAVAEELTQEAFVDAVRMRNRFDGRSDPVTWVVAIARHKMADHYRRLVRTERRRLHLVTTGPPPDDDMADTERREDILHALRSLPPTQRAALLYRYLDDLPISAIAVQIGRTESATESLLARAREALRRTLETEEDADG